MLNALNTIYPYLGDALFGAACGLLAGSVTGLLLRQILEQRKVKRNNK